MPQKMKCTQQTKNSKHQVLLPVDEISVNQMTLSFLEFREAWDNYPFPK